jgi:hypothetical protein
MSKPLLPRVVFAVLVTGMSACEHQPVEVVSTWESATTFASASETQGALLAEIRAATAHYQLVENALADGYVPAQVCIYSASGGRGIIYANFPRIDGVVDHTQPELLFYEPAKNGDLRLVAAAFLVRSATWDASNSSPPALGDQVFIDRRTAPFGADFPNYVLFAWVWRNNPDGMHAPYNPQVSCEFAEISEER